MGLQLSELEHSRAQARSWPQSAVDFPQLFCHFD